MSSFNSKRGSFTGIIYLVGGLMILLFAAFIFVFGSATLNWVFDEAMPEFRGLGMVGDFNATQATDIALGPVDTIVQNMSWFGGFLYILGILAVFGLAFAFRLTNEKWLIPLFFVMMFVLILVCIFMSNMYQDFYNGTDEIATRMQEQEVLSFFMIYSPAIFSIVGFLAGAIMFSAPSEYGQPGGTF